MLRNLHCHTIVLVHCHGSVLRQVHTFGDNVYHSWSCCCIIVAECLLLKLREVVESCTAEYVTQAGAPPLKYAIQDHLEDAPNLQAVVTDAQEPALPRSQWHREMDRRVTSSDMMMQEIHAMVLALHTAPAAGSAPAALGWVRTGDRRPGSRCSGMGARFPGATSRDRSSCYCAANVVWFWC